MRRARGTRPHPPAEPFHLRGRSIAVRLHAIAAVSRIGDPRPGAEAQSIPMPYARSHHDRRRPNAARHRAPVRARGPVGKAHRGRASSASWPRSTSACWHRAGIQLGAAEAQKRAAERNARPMRRRRPRPPPRRSGPGREGPSWRHRRPSAGGMTPAREQTAVIRHEARRHVRTVQRPGRPRHERRSEPADLLATVLTTRGGSRRDSISRGKDGRSSPDRDDKKTIELDRRQRDAPTGAGRTTGSATGWWCDGRSDGLRIAVRHRASVGDLLPTLRRTSARDAGFGSPSSASRSSASSPVLALTRICRRLATASIDCGRRLERPRRSRPTDEVGRLATAFNQMAEDVELHQRSAVEQERIKRERASSSAGDPDRQRRRRSRCASG